MVRQARVCVVNKLIKEAKLFRTRHGNEVQQEKYKRKADKLIAEVYALKGIQNDEITKFGITNDRDLTAILQDESSSHCDRVMARVAHYKTLYKRLMQFKEKFPDCKRYLVEGTKKNVKLKNKGVAKTKKSLKENPRPRNENSEEQKINSCKNIEHSQYEPKNEKTCNTKLLEATSNLHECKISNEDSTPLKEEKVSRLQDDILEDTVIHKQPSVIKPCNITREATVKRFTELLEEQESSKNVEMPIKVPDSTTQQAKVLDDFFITGDNQALQTISISAPTSYVKSHKHNTQVKTFQSNNRIEKQNINHKNNTNFHKRYQDKQSIKSVKRLNNKTSIKINKGTKKNNSNDVNKKEDTDLHPSWLAKRKEQKIIKFQGKKIMFADD